MAGILLFHAHHRQAVGAALRRQVEIGDLGKLLLQDGHEDFVERHPEDRRFVGRTAGVGAVVDGLAPVGDALDGEDGEFFHLVVIASVVAKGAFGRGVVGLDHPFEDELGARRHLKVIAQAAGHFGARTAQQAGEGILRKGVRHRRHRRQNGGGIGAQSHRNRKGLAGMLLLPVAEIQRAAAVGQPAHDDAVAADHLHPVDAEVLARLFRAAGDHQAPGDEGAGVLRPAGLHRKPGQIHLIAFQHHFLTGRAAPLPGRHVQHLAIEGQLLEGVFHAARRVGLLESGEQPAHLAQGAHLFFAHAQGHPLGGAEEIGKHRDAMALGVFEEQRRAAGAQHPVGDLGHLQVRIHRHGDALELAARLQAGDEIAQISVLHGWFKRLPARC